MTTPQNLEIEAKLYLSADDWAAMPARLVQIDAVVSAERVYERNIRYEDATQSLTAAHKVIRLRQDSRVRLTYKEPSATAYDGIQARTELEVTVSDFETMHLILGKLGYQTAWEYEKYRTTYHWQTVEIVLDELPYGHFIEIEGDAQHIEAAIRALGLSGQPRIGASYSDLFFQLKTRLNLPFTDLTFANFEMVTLPADPRTWLAGG